MRSLNLSVYDHAIIECLGEEVKSIEQVTELCSKNELFDPDKLRHKVANTLQILVLKDVVIYENNKYYVNFETLKNNQTAA